MKEAEKFYKENFPENYKSLLRLDFVFRNVVFNAMQQYADEQKDKLDDYKKALEIIAHPINYLQSEAKKDGGILDSYAASQLANDSNWLRGIAINALESNQEGE